MTDSIIRLLGVTKTYAAGNRRPLRSTISGFEVGPGDFTSLMGPSGSGRTSQFDRWAAFGRLWGSIGEEVRSRCFGRSLTCLSPPAEDRFCLSSLQSEILTVE